MFKKFMVYLDDGVDCFKVAVPAKNRKEAEEYTKGNGDIVAIKDITEDIPISAEFVADALINAGFGRVETDLIVRTIQYTGIAE